MPQQQAIGECGAAGCEIVRSWRRNLQERKPCDRMVDTEYSGQACPETLRSIPWGNSRRAGHRGTQDGS